jgi:hypothetical protein
MSSGEGTSAPSTTTSTPQAPTSTTSANPVTPPQ